MSEYRLTDDGWVEVDWSGDPMSTVTVPTPIIANQPLPGDTATCAFCAAFITLSEPIKNIWLDDAQSHTCAGGNGRLHCNVAPSAVPGAYNGPRRKSSTQAVDNVVAPKGTPAVIGQIRRVAGLTKTGPRKGQPYARHTVIKVSNGMVTVRYNSGKEFEMEQLSYEEKTEVLAAA